MKKLVLLTMIIMGVFNMKAQVMTKSYTTFKAMQKRTLIVQILDENGAEIQKLQKRIVKIKKNNKRKLKLIEELEAKKKFVKAFNVLSKEVIPEYWKLNKEIIFKTAAEIKKIPKSKLRKYAVLRFFTWAKSYYYFDQGGSQTISAPMFEYVKPETKKPEYQMFLFNTDYNFGNLAFKGKKKKQIEKDLKSAKSFNPFYSEENLITTLMMVQQHIKYMIDHKKTLKFDKYGVIQAKKNCKELKGKDLMIQKAMVQTKILNQLKKYYKNGKIILATPQQIADAISDQKDVLIGFPHTHHLLRTHSSFGNITVGGSKGVYEKLVINPSTWKIVAFLKVSGITNFPEFRKGDFKKLDTCKF